MNIPRDGTPKTLSHAILNGMPGSLATSRYLEMHVDSVLQHVKDFAAQKFTIAMMQSSNEGEEIALKLLFETIFGEKL
jgi:hypothetical protein